MVAYLVSEQAVGYRQIGIGNPQSCRRPSLNEAFFSSLANYMASSSKVATPGCKKTLSLTELGVGGKVTGSQGLSLQEIKGEEPTLNKVVTPLKSDLVILRERLNEAIAEGKYLRCRSFQLTESQIGSIETDWADTLPSAPEINMPICKARDFPAVPAHTVTVGPEVADSAQVALSYQNDKSFTYQKDGNDFASISLQIGMEETNYLIIDIISNNIRMYICSTDIQNPGYDKLKSLNSDYFGIIKNTYNNRIKKIIYTYHPI